MQVAPKVAMVAGAIAYRLQRPIQQYYAGKYGGAGKMSGKCGMVSGRRLKH